MKPPEASYIQWEAVALEDWSQDPELKGFYIPGVAE